MAPEKFQAAFEKQEVTEVDWDDAISTILTLAEMHSKETDISVEQLQLVLAMEEFSELSQELSKVIRRRGNNIAVLEELADVTLMCKYIQTSMGFSNEDIARAVNVKLGRYSKDKPNTETC